MHHTRLRSELARWRHARQAVLSTVCLSGAMVMMTLPLMPCPRAAAPTQAPIVRAETYSGVGLQMECLDGACSIEQVFEGAPADGKIEAGAFLVGVDGLRPSSAEEWVRAIRGPAGSDVTLEVSYGCGENYEVTLTRSVIHVPR